MAVGGKGLAHGNCYVFMHAPGTEQSICHWMEQKKVDFAKYKHVFL